MSRIPPPAPTRGPDIVVTARKASLDQLASHQTLRLSGVSSRYELSSPAGSGGGTGSAPNTSVGVVNVQMDNQSALNEAIEAAENIALGIAIILDKLSLADPNAIVVWGGTNLKMTVAEVTSLITRTEWVVSDQMWGNGGVGASFAATSTTPPRDYLHYKEFRGEGGYASSSYTKFEGLVGILLHETGHLSNAGAAFLNASEGIYGRKNNNDFTHWVNSNLYINNEKNANDFMAAAAAIAGLDIARFSPKFSYGSVAPSRVP